MKDNKKLNLYFYQITKGLDVTHQFGIEFADNDLFKGLKEANGECIIKILGKTDIASILDIIEELNFDMYPKRLKKKQFLNNLKYTKDSLVKSPLDRETLETIINKIS